MRAVFRVARLILFGFDLGMGGSPAGGLFGWIFPGKFWGFAFSGEPGAFLQRGRCPLRTSPSKEALAPSFPTSCNRQ